MNLELVGYKCMSVKVVVEIPLKIVDSITNNDQLGLFLAATWKRYMDKYVPVDQGMLYQTADATKPFEVSYIQNYSHYQWEGLSKSGKKLRYSKEQHPLAQSHWEKAAYKDNVDNVAKEVKEYLRRM